MHAIEVLEDQVWETPDSYGGFDPVGDFVVLTRNRASSIIEESNWDSACEELGAEAYDGGEGWYEDRPVVYHWRAGHWACGWVEYLMVRADAPDSVKERAGEIIAALADYPVLDAEDWAAREHDAVVEYWEDMTMRERIEVCIENGLSMFAARNGYPPGGRVYAEIREYVGC